MKTAVKFILLLFTIFAILPLLPGTGRLTTAKAVCPTPFITITATTHNLSPTVDFAFSQTVGQGNLFIHKLSSPAIPDKTINVDGRSGYSIDLSDGLYNAVLFYSVCEISYNVQFSPGSGSTSLVLNNPSITDNTASFSFTPAPYDSILMISGPVSHTELLTAGQTSFNNWTGADGSYTAVIKDRGGVNISNVVGFGLPGAITPPSDTSGGAECTSFGGCTDIPGSQPPGFSENTFVTDLISKFLPIAIGLGGFLSVILVIVSGLQFITSSGNPEGAASARGRLIFALVGFVLLTLAFAITKVVDTLLLRGSGIF